MSTLVCSNGLQQMFNRKRMLFSYARGGPLKLRDRKNTLSEGGK